MKESFIQLFEESLKAGKFITPQPIGRIMASSNVELSILAYYINDFLKEEWNSFEMKRYRFFLWREEKRLTAEARLSQEWNKLRYKTGLGLKRIGRWFNRKGDNVMQTTPSDRE